MQRRPTDRWGRSWSFAVVVDQGDRLADQAQRDRIANDLGTTMLVEAAAGTGKTTSMIARMVAMLAEDRCTIDAMAAVTFTRKATAEMRSRFQIALEKAVAGAEGPRRARLNGALDQLERCFIGTIHSFCARLLRERPIEAGIDVAFEELDEHQEFRLRRAAWDEYVAQLHARNDPLLAELEQLSLELRELEEAYIDFAVYPDVKEWPTEQVVIEQRELDEATQALRGYAAHMETIAPTLTVDPGYDTLMPLYGEVPRHLRHARPGHPGDLIDILDRIAGANVVQRNWPGGKSQGAREKKIWQQFTDRHAEPLAHRRRRQRYAPSLRVLQGAAAVYNRMREAAGALSFEDLLIRAAALLRDKPDIRRYFRRRFGHLLVDEFQDTDPIQAEVMLLLTADDDHQPDWRSCRPRPGSLFVVGDPKQSIYRFRRADIVTYSEVRHIIKACGSVVELTSNFRSIRPVIEWINGVSTKKLFPKEADDTTPVDCPMHAARRGADDGDIRGVLRLDIPDACKDREGVAEYEAELIARVIRSAVGQRTVAGTGRPARFGDFLVLTWQRQSLIVFAQKLQALGIPVEVTGGTAVNDVEEVALLHAALAAVVGADDPVALVGALRSELFGISDADLYRFARSGGQFNYRHPNDGVEISDNLDAALGRLRIHAQWFEQMPAAAAIERIAGDLGLTARALAAAGGPDRAGAVCKAIELLRAASGERWTAADLVEYLGGLVHADEFPERHDGMPVQPHREPPVRVMNLHQAKGLEAPVVFLADGAGRFTQDPLAHIDRSGQVPRGYLSVRGLKWNNTRRQLAEPPGWEQIRNLEKQFLEAEGKRLVYVAMTRAGSQLVISKPGSRRAASRNPWSAVAGEVADDQVLERPPEPESNAVPTRRLAMTAPQDAAQESRRRWGRMVTPTYRLAAAKEITVRGGVKQVAAGEHGTEWGTVIHVLLEAAMARPGADLAALAATTLDEQQLDPREAPRAVDLVRAVTRSDLWSRARAADRCLVEVPIQFLEPATGIAPDTIVRGVIDLAFREPDGWVIADYKTDDQGAASLDGLVEHYAPQVRLYAEAWARLLGEPVHETGLFFVHSGEYRVVGPATTMARA